MLELNFNRKTMPQSTFLHSTLPLKTLFMKILVKKNPERDARGLVVFPFETLGIAFDGLCHLTCVASRRRSASSARREDA